MTVRLSGLARGLARSGTMAADERLQTLRAAGRDIVSLGAGQLDFDTPEPIARAGAEAIARGRTRYTPVAGTVGLRRAVCAKFERENGLRYGEEEVIVGAGAKSVIYHALLALVEPGDEVILPTPAWPSYASMITLTGGRVREVALAAGDDYQLTPAALRAALAAAGGRARGLILNSPHNPTGAVLARERLAELAAVAREADLWVISDEIYEHLVYEGRFASVAAAEGMRDRTLTVNGVSKGFAMTGWRIGYGGGPATLVGAMEALQSHTSGNPSSISQEAAESALRLSLAGDAALAAVRREVCEALQERRDLACHWLSAVPDITWVRPAGAFYLFVDVSRHYGRTLGGRVIRGSADLANHLLEHAGVAVVAGDLFGDDRCLRVSFAAARHELETAFERFARALR